MFSNLFIEFIYTQSCLTSVDVFTATKKDGRKRREKWGNGCRRARNWREADDIEKQSSCLENTISRGCIVKQTSTAIVRRRAGEPRSLRSSLVSRDKAFATRLPTGECTITHASSAPSRLLRNLN